MGGGKNMEGTLYQDFKRTYMIGLIFYKTRKYDEAKVYLTKAIGMADEIMKQEDLTKTERAAINYMSAQLEDIVKKINEKNNQDNQDNQDNQENQENQENCAA